MSIETQLAQRFRDVMDRFNASPAVKLLTAGQLTVPHYKAILRETYHYAKEDPQIQALAAVHFRGDDRDMVRQFLKHALSEIGHDQMALQDLSALGEDVSVVRDSFPLPSTIAFTAFPFYQITYHNPIGYLGYLYFLEFMPTHAGATYGAALRQAGIPDSAMTFLAEHVTVDVAHNKLMERYVASLIRTDADLEAVEYAMGVTGHLYGQLLWNAIESASAGQPERVNAMEAVRRSPAMHGVQGLVRTAAGSAA